MQGKNISPNPQGSASVPNLTTKMQGKNISPNPQGSASVPNLTAKMQGKNISPNPQGSASVPNLTAKMQGKNISPNPQGSASVPNLTAKMQGKVIVLSAPSGSGKSTIINELLKIYPQLEFSISATSRAPRGNEQDGCEYYFFSHEEFMGRVEKGAFLEWEAVYEGTAYGTLKSEIERIWGKGNIAVFDVDVVGGINIKRIFGDSAVSIFIMPPSIEELEARLIKRATDSPEAILKRVSKATSELQYAPQFDNIVINDDLSEAIEETSQIVHNFVGK